MKPVVNALDLERLPEVASRIEQKLSRLGLAPQIVLDPLVVCEDVVRRFGGHVFKRSALAIFRKLPVASVPFRTVASREPIDTGRLIRVERDHLGRIVKAEAAVPG
jgi:hypothetical protein